ncbi:ATP-binding cassette domain-containing protein [Candidatus Thiodictyon syntrophicum]|uniref:ATP-binding cassette domain-containing protein n=1 Tax=Candidatus Thiodictyon syntrophicum TaxID=1166950 RepID=UPI001EFF9FE9|nr:ATP-binding cassette domain-containing protein [Candidatus Thiodictyon syntrophicum]
MPQAFVLVNGQPVDARQSVRHGDWLVFGSSAFQVFLPEASEAADEREPDIQFGGSARPAPVVVGRLPNCGLTIDSPLISREHARLLPTADGLYLEDLRSTNGTFVNADRILEPVLLAPGDQVSFATFVYLFTGSALHPAQSGGRVRVEARNLTKTVTDRTTKQPRHLLDGIDLVIEPGEFVVIFGTSGSGKSTLLDSLNGRRPATSGRVLYNGVNLYDSFAAFRAGIGYVPQQDIVHRKITIRNALRYTARLRLPRDTSAAEIAAHIDRVLQRVGLFDKGNLAVDTPEPLSGGQLKRVNLAVELVANPNVLFLDEATSGLDAGTDKKMMRLFAELAADGKTVICVTHTLENVASCHLVALLHQGVLVYYGPPADVPDYFGIARLSEVYERLDGEDARRWGERFRASDHFRRFVQSRLSADAAPRRMDAAPRAKSSAAVAGRSGWLDPRQIWTLTRRYLDLLHSDRLNLAVLLLQAPLIALVVGAIFDTSGTPLERAQTHGQITFVLVLSAIWFGGINSCREIVKELPVYLRERAVVLRIPAYMLSKLLPLAALCAIQCLSFLAIVTLMLDFPGPFLERLLTLFLAGFAATGMGLAVSAFVASNDKAIATLPLLLIPQFILSNAIVPLDGIAEALAKVTVIAYWGVDAMRATLEAPVLALRGPDGSLLIAVNGDWATDSLALGGLALGFLIIAAVGLKLRDRKV